MPVVRCPLCKERVTGENVSDLSEGVESHLTEVHSWSPEELEEQKSVAPRGFSQSILEAESIVQVSYGTKGETAEERKGSVRGPGGGLMVDEQEQSFEAGDTTTMAGMGGEWVQGKLVKDSGSEESRGIHMEESAVECPLCKERVMGTDEESLSDNFDRHMMTTHKNEPFITRFMEERKDR